MTTGPSLEESDSEKQRPPGTLSRGPHALIWKTELPLAPEGKRLCSQVLLFYDPMLITNKFKKLNNKAINNPGS